MLTYERVEAEALKLDRSQRARLAERLISSFDDDSEIEEAWDGVADERYRRYLAGEEEARPASRPLAEIRAELGL